MMDHLTVDARQTIRWAYSFLLGREPENEAVIDSHLRSEGGASLEAVRRRLLRSDEFVSSMRQAGFDLGAAGAVIGPLEGMLDTTPPPPTEGAFTDRFGVRTRVNYLPGAYRAYSGKVGALDGSFDMPVHDPEELNALLRSVAEAKGQFAAMELGAGWGPWIVLGAHLAARKGLAAALTGVEGSEDHVAFMRTHLTDNGLAPEAHHVVHAVVGTYDGVAYFPKLPDPSGDWGAEAKYEPGKSAAADVEEVPCISLRTLLGRTAVLDFLHCDVQGAEADVFAAAIETVNERVRRTCIGTHSRAIEARLLDMLVEHGWILEFEQPCKVQQAADKFILLADGVQVWRNPRAL